MPHAVGATIAYPAFTSTSQLDRVAMPGGTLIVISSRTGKFIGGISRFPGEAEVLFQPAATFAVLINRVIGGIREIYLEEV